MPQMLRCPLIILLLLLPAAAGAQHAVRVGVQAGAVVESSERVTITSSAETVATTTGMAGLEMIFPLSASWFMICAPQYSQRNYSWLELGRKGNSSYGFSYKQMDRLGVPLLIGCTPFQGDLVRPYLAAGMEFGMNLSGTHVTVIEVQHGMEQELDRMQNHALSITQLFGAALLEVGFDVQAGASLSVVLAGRFSQELSPLIDDPLFTYGTPSNWTVRFGLLYELPH